MKKVLILAVVSILLVTASVLAKEHQTNGKPFEEIWDEWEDHQRWVESFFDVVMGRLDDLEDNVTTLQGIELNCTTNSTWPTINNTNPGYVTCPEGYEITGCTGGVDTNYLDGWFMFSRSVDGTRCIVSTDSTDPVPAFVQATCCKVSVP